MRKNIGEVLAWAVLYGSVVFTILVIGGKLFPNLSWFWLNAIAALVGALVTTYVRLPKKPS